MGCSNARPPTPCALPHKQKLPPSVTECLLAPFESECVSGGQETGEFGTENRANAHSLSLFSLFEVALDEEAGQQ